MLSSHFLIYKKEEKKKYKIAKPTSKISDIQMLK